MKIMIGFLAVTCLSMSVIAFAEKKTQPSLETGALVFKQRCVLCHGPSGMGEGLLPLRLAEYPNTNLRLNAKAVDRSKIHEAVVYGGTKGNLSNLMPPMGNELTWTEIESVVDFVMLLRTDVPIAQKLLDRTSSKIKANRRLGKQIYESRCVLCHGEFGEGDGRMAKVIKSPPPANLASSRLPDDYLKKIITQGGEGVSRSPQMPPWKDQFDSTELESVIIYIKALRE